MDLPVLPPEDFEVQLRRLGRGFVLFTADWCGFCARFAPAFEAAARRHGSPGAAFAVADISDDEADPRWDRYGIAAVPTVLYVEDGQPLARLDAVLGRGLRPEAFEGFVRARLAPP